MHRCFQSCREIEKKPPHCSQDASTSDKIECQIPSISYFRASMSKPSTPCIDQIPECHQQNRAPQCAPVLMFVITLRTFICFRSGIDPRHGHTDLRIRLFSSAGFQDCRYLSRKDLFWVRGRFPRVVYRCPFRTPLDLASGRRHFERALR